MSENNFASAFLTGLGIAFALGVLAGSCSTEGRFESKLCKNEPITVSCPTVTNQGK